MLTDEVESQHSGLWGLIASWWMSLTLRDSSLSAPNRGRVVVKRCQRKYVREGGATEEWAELCFTHPFRFNGGAEPDLYLSVWLGRAGREERGATLAPQQNERGVNAGTIALQGLCCHICRRTPTWHQQGHLDSRRRLAWLCAHAGSWLASDTKQGNLS